MTTECLHGNGPKHDVYNHAYKLSIYWFNHILCAYDVDYSYM